MSLFHGKDGLSDPPKDSFLNHQTVEEMNLSKGSCKAGRAGLVQIVPLSFSSFSNASSNFSVCNCNAL